MPDVPEAKVAKAEDAVKKLYEDAQKRAEEIKKEKILEAKHIQSEKKSLRQKMRVE